MKAKEKEINLKIKELCEVMGDKDRFFVFRASGDSIIIALPNNEDVGDERISAALASTIQEHLLGCDNEGVERLSEIIIDAIEALIGVSPVAGAKLTERFAKAALIGMKKSLEKIVDDTEEDEDCGDCGFVKECTNKNAIKYRKGHGIPKPKKNKKGGQKIEVN